MSETRKNHLSIDGEQEKEDDHVASYKPIPDIDGEFRKSKTSLHKSKEKIPSDEAEEKLLQKEDEAKITTRVDMSEAKYVVGDHRNGDANIELDANKRQFTGLTKEELMKYADDPFWVRLRWFMFVLFWALWAGMLVGAVAIIIRAPKCAAPPPRTWYQKWPLVDFSSLEDLQAVEAELPLLQSSQVAGAYVFSCKDSYEVLEDDSPCLLKFKEFVGKAKQLGVKVIAELTANFVSTSHRWFQLSENRTGEYSSYFVWAPASPRDPDQPAGLAGVPLKLVPSENDPNWAKSENRGEYYLRQYGVDLPDLNFSNSDVVKHFDDVINIWMKAGADGIRLNKAIHLVVNSSLEEEQPRIDGNGESAAEQPLWSDRHITEPQALRDLLAHWSHLVDLAYTPSSAGESVFTLAESGQENSLYENLLYKHSSPTLRPPSAPPLSLGGSERDVAAAVSALERVLRRGWPAVQLTSEQTDDELAAFSLLLPAAPVLRAAQLRDRDDATRSSEWLRRALVLRNDASVSHGASVLSNVTGVRDEGARDGDARDGTVALLACARWKPGHTGYVAVYNPGGAAARAQLLPLTPHMPAAVAPAHWSPRTQAYTNYTTSSPVDSSLALVPPRSTVIFSFVPQSTAKH